MKWSDFFRDTMKLDRESYMEMLQEAQGLRDDKRRLQAEVDEMKRQVQFLTAENKNLHAIVEAAKNQQITPEMIARKLRIPVEMVDKIDLTALGVQLGQERR